MPELPEVETIARQLQSKIAGKTILGIEVLDKKVIDENIANILPSRIVDVSRRGKSIIIQLEQKNNLLAHLRMTGHFYHIANQDRSYIANQDRSYIANQDRSYIANQDRSYIANRDKSYKKYLSGIFKLNNGSFFTFNEIRRFGSVKLFTNEQLNRELSKLGPEPLSIKDVEFAALLKNYPSSVIKTKLLDQTCLAGIGNIYAQEMLYHAGINPLKKIRDISEAKLALLHQEMQRILRLAIQNNGATADNYSHLAGRGNFQNFLAVYGQERCPKKHQLAKIKMGGRGTSYCKVCQE